MSVFVFTALFSAFFADARAQCAHFFRKHLTFGHKSRSDPANFGAIKVQFDTSAHHLYIVFFQTGGGTVVAGSGAVITGLNT